MGATRFHDPKGWLLDSLPWRLRRIYIARAIGVRVSDVPNAVRMVCLRRLSQAVMDYFEEMERRERPAAVRDQGGNAWIGQRNGRPVGRP